MRLWHYKLIEVLPRTQLLAQWRELNSIYKKEDNHILINYIYNYDRERLLYYSLLVIEEFKKRGYNIKKWDNYDLYFDKVDKEKIKLAIKNDDVKIWAYKEHDEMYLTICKYNLYEKYIRGQKDIGEALIEHIMDLN